MKPNIQTNYHPNSFSALCDKCLNSDKCFWYNKVPIANLHFISKCNQLKEKQK